MNFLINRNNIKHLTNNVNVHTFIRLLKVIIVYYKLNVKI